MEIELQCIHEARDTVVTGQIKGVEYVAYGCKACSDAAKGVGFLEKMGKTHGL